MVRSSASVSPWHMVTQLHSMDRISFFGSKSKKLSPWTSYYATRTVSGTSAALYGSIDKCSQLIPPLFSAHWTPRVDSQEPISKIKFYQGKFPEWHFKTIRDLGLDTCPDYLEGIVLRWRHIFASMKSSSTALADYFLSSRTSSAELWSCLVTAEGGHFGVGDFIKRTPYFCVERDRTWAG